MIEYTIRLELEPEKVNEFAQSWKFFCDHAKETEGLCNCTMTDLGDKYYEISMTWSERYYLNLFMKGEWYNFILGAVSVLGEKSVITQRDVHSD